MPAANEQEVLRVPFEYVVNQVLTALQDFNGAIQIQQDADFEWVFRISSQSGTFQIQITDLATGRVLMNLPVNNANYLGTAQLPFPNLEPYIFARSSSIGVRLIDTSNAGNTIQVVFGGYKLFPASAQGQGSSGALVQM
jgi:hypothetical protein